MSILTWLKEVTTGTGKAEFIESGELTFADGEEQFNGLDMKAALDAHTRWTQRLAGKLNGTNPENLDAATVSSDADCRLGKWIHGTAKKRFGQLPAYEELRQIHADFHRKAGEILHSVAEANSELARAYLRELRHQSGQVQLALVRLYSHARD